MKKDNGASPEGDRAAQASPEAPAGLRHAVSIPSAFERSVTFSPSFNKLAPEPSKNYGIGAVTIRFVLKGELGAVQWMIGTEWFVASARKHLRQFGLRDLDTYCKPTGWDLGYHSPRPLYEGQDQMAQCDVLSVPCYYDGSGLNADLLIENFLAEGDAYVWRALEAYYEYTFNDAPWPFDKEGNVVASGIAARSDETPAAAQPERQEPARTPSNPEDSPNG